MCLLVSANTLTFGMLAYHIVKYPLKCPHAETPAGCFCIVLYCINFISTQKTVYRMTESRRVVHTREEMDMYIW